VTVEDNGAAFRGPHPTRRMRMVNHGNRMGRDRDRAGGR
jgi:hypothetical protein